MFFINIWRDVLVQFPDVDVRDILRPSRSVRSVERNRNFCLPDETLDQCRFSLGFKVVAASWPHFHHATFGVVIVSLPERRNRSAFAGLGLLRDLCNKPQLQLLPLVGLPGSKRC